MNTKKDLATGKWELWRRLLLLLCCALAAWFYMYVSTTPLLRVHNAQMERRQEREIAGQFVTERQRHLAVLPLEEYASVIAGENLVFVEGSEWEIFIRKIAEQNGTNHSTIAPRFFFGTEKEPLRKAWIQAANPQDPVFIEYIKADGSKGYMQVTYMTFTNDDFMIGGIGGSYNTPPDDLLYPIRSMAYVFMLVGVLLYVKIPKPKRYADSMHYSSWKNRLLDIIGVALFTMFFALPLFITGGSVQSLALMMPLVIVFWGMAILCSSLMYIAAWNASFSMKVKEDQLMITNYRGGYRISYQDINFIQPADKRYPGWFKWVMFFAMLGSKGSMASVMTSHWINSTGVQSQGLRIHMKNGERIDFWLMDQMGNPIFSRVEKLVHSLSGADIPCREEVVTDRSLTHVPGGVGFWDKKPVMIPYVATCTLFLLVMIGSLWVSRVAMVSEIPYTEESVSIEEQVTYPEFDGIPLGIGEKEWVRHFGAEGVERGVVLKQIPEGGYMIAGVSNSGNYTRPASYLIQTDEEGNLIWEERYPTLGKDSINQGMIITQAGHFLLTGNEGDYRGRDIFVKKVSGAGEEQWHRHDSSEENSGGVDLWEHPEGDFFVLLNRGALAKMKRMDSRGNLIWENPIGIDNKKSSASKIVSLSEEHFLISGSVVKEAEEFWKAAIMMVDNNGNTLWQREYGRDGDDRILDATLLDDGSIAFIGFTHADSGLFRSVSLLITDVEGKEERNKSYPISHYHGTGTAIVELSDGNLALLVNVNKHSTTHDFALIAILDRQGNIVSVHVLDADGDVRGSDMILSSDGSILITGRSDGQDMFGSTNAFLMKISY
ncbi:hypothetical protein [Tindallia californiensis]|uniref:PQQ-like domain-containing protein n=1 Tax=Tindallia californiensis TaxID=159292 RepID=A0A1H3KG34_9FIRM|nr:hypothetical protein [Tindallia californiensis]SDY50544.1 hypothetical protein SAMN05192546_102329 [Tindallia californiensis]